MTFVLKEFSHTPKHYSISQKVETQTGIFWKEVACVRQRSTAFFLMNLIEKISK